MSFAWVVPPRTKCCRQLSLQIIELEEWNAIRKMIHEIMADDEDPVIVNPFGLDETILSSAVVYLIAHTMGDVAYPNSGINVEGNPFHAPILDNSGVCVDVDKPC